MSSITPSPPSQSHHAKKDHWTASSYTSSASFVPKLASKVQTWLSANSSDTILDLGCGDGVLTSQIAQACTRVIGLDSSSNLIAAAAKSYPASEKLQWEVADVRALEQSTFLQEREGTFDKVFSNAALHWILREEGSRVSVLRAAYKALKPGGTFVFEMGGAGNVAEVHAALILVTARYAGISVAEARDSSPWFFPSDTRMEEMLREVGFEVLRCELEYRATKLEEKSGEEGGVEGWVRLMGCIFLDIIEDKEKREDAIRDVCESLRGICGREEDGSEWLGYVRLRAEAKKGDLK